MNKLKISSRKKEALMHHIHLEIFSSISWLKQLNSCLAPFLTQLPISDSGPWVWPTLSSQQCSWSRSWKWLSKPRVSPAASCFSSYSLCSSHSPLACLCAWTLLNASCTLSDSTGLNSRTNSLREQAIASLLSHLRQFLLKKWKEKSD